MKLFSVVMIDLIAILILYFSLGCPEFMSIKYISMILSGMLFVASGIIIGGN